MTIVLKVDGVWQALHGVQKLTATMAVKTQIDEYGDGRREVREVECEPYEVERELDMGRIAVLVADGVWSEVDLAPLGLKVAAPFTPDPSKQRVGGARYVERDGEVVEEYDQEDIPPPPPEPTPAEKLASLGLSVDDLKALLGGGAGE